MAKPTEAVANGGAPPVAATAAAAPGSKGAKRRRSGSGAGGDVAVSAEEAERRRVQRELRELAMKLRTEGKDYKPQKYKRKMYVAEGAGKARSEKKKAKGANKRIVRVAVLPIFWEQRQAEMKAVVTAAKKVEELLSTLGVRVVVDDNNKFTPGQRMKHWEELGVPVRVEIGPQDVAKGMCVVAIAGEVGTVAQKSKVKMGKQVVMTVRKALAAAGVELAPSSGAGDAGAAGVVSGGADHQAVEAKASRTSEDAEGSDKGEDDGDGGSEEAGDAAGASGAGGSDGGAVGSVPGGDDMDDFEIDVEAEEDELLSNKREAAKKRRKEERAREKEKKRAARRAASGVGSDDAPGWQDEEAGKKSTAKKAKVVVFK